jgi:hypothetical protein
MEIAHSHLTYCTNIHAGESWQDHFFALKKHFPAIKKQVSPDQAMGIGLRLSNLASQELIKTEAQQDFKQWLEENQAYVFTMNGFPYGGFHRTRVKDQVHTPDWTTKERVEYTIRLFRILSSLIPGNMEGGISTSPLSYKGWLNTPGSFEKVRDLATKNILLVAEELIHIRQTTGTRLHLDIEPEPDGLLETGEEFIYWYESHLLPVGIEQLSKKMRITSDEAEGLLKAHICLCYDVCHFAIGYEPHDLIINKLAKKRIRVGKIQISAALKAGLPSDLAARSSITDAFSKFDEPTYLHQVVARSGNALLRYPDLPEALSDKDNLSVTEWRAHFHVPVFIETLDILQTTQADIIRILEIHKANPFTQHLEVETYTWEVLPEKLKLEIGPSIIREMNWVKKQL